MAGASTKGIRSYGPGKFYTIVDGYAYAATLDGGADEEESYPDGDGWYGLLWVSDGVVDRIREEAADEKDELTDEEEALLDESVAVIFFERSDGIVETEWYDDKKEAEEAWADIEKEMADLEEEGEEEDEEEEEEDD
jgi:hypothetical protein